MTFESSLSFIKTPFLTYLKVVKQKQLIEGILKSTWPLKKHEFPFVSRCRDQTVIFAYVSNQY